MPTWQEPISITLTEADFFGVVGLPGQGLIRNVRVDTEEVPGPYPVIGSLVITPSLIGIRNQTKTITVFIDLGGSLVPDGPPVIQRTITRTFAITAVPDADVLVPEGYTYDSTTKILQQIPEAERMPVITPKPEGEVTPPPSPCKKPDNPFDFGAWFEYFICSIIQAFTGVGGALTALGEALGSAIASAFEPVLRPILDFFKGIQEGLTAIIGAWVDFIKDPAGSIVKGFLGFFTEASPSPIARVITEVPQLNATALSSGMISEAFSNDAVRAKIQQLVAEYTPRLFSLLARFDIEPETFRAESATLQADFERDVHLFTWFWKFPILDSLVGQVDDRIESGVSSLPVKELAALYWRELINSATGERLRQKLNQLYQVKIPPFEELVRARRLELLEADEYADLLAKQSGINRKLADTLYLSSFNPPTLEHFVTWRLRYPDVPLTFDSFKEIRAPGTGDVMERIAAIANIDVPRFGGIFAEQFIDDPTIIQARFMYETKAIERDQVFDIIRRNRYRTFTLPGQLKSDAQALTDFITNFQSRIWDRQILLAARQLYIAGFIDEARLRKEASDTFLRDQAVEKYVRAAKLRREFADEKNKKFTVSQLVSLRSGDYITDEFIDAELEDMDYDREHRRILKKFIDDQVKAKAS